MAAEENPGLSPERHKELFEHFCRQKFRDGGRGCSKTVSTKKREKVLRYLGNKLDPASSPHFRFWVKQRGFQLVEQNGVQAVCLPNKHWVESDPRSVQWKRVSSVEEFFDVIAAHHLLEDGSHLGIKKTLGRIVENYDCVTRTAVEGYIDLCPGCQGRARKRSARPHNQSRPSGSGSGSGGSGVGVGGVGGGGGGGGGGLEDDKTNLLSFMSYAQVDLIDMSSHADGDYRWLGHFADHWSCFHILFPLTSVSADEVARNLSRLVFGVFGVPQLLHCNLGRQFTTQVVQALSVYWQGDAETEVATTRPHNPVLDEATSKLEEMIAEYVVQRPLWTQWLPFLQYSLNTEISDKLTWSGGVSKSPYTMVFSSMSIHKSGGEEEEEEREGELEEETEEEEEGEERVQLEVISDSITLPSTVWQTNIHSIPPISSTTTTTSQTYDQAQTPNSTATARGVRGTDGGKGSGDMSTQQIQQNVSQSPPTKTTVAGSRGRESDEGGGGGGGEGGKGDDTMSVQQILMPPDADFLSSFYEAAQLTEGNSRKRRRKQTPSRIAAAPPPHPPLAAHATPTNITS